MTEDKAASENENLRTTRIKTALQFIPVISLLIAALSFFFTQGLRKKELTCSYLGFNNLIQLTSSPLAPDLKVQLQDKQVLSLSKINITIRNTGASAIKGDDVKEPLGLQFPPGTNILNASVDSTSPANFTFKLLPIDKTGLIEFQFPLLNSGDAVHLSIYTYNSKPSAPVLVGRIVDVTQLRTEDISASEAIVPLSFLQPSWLRVITKWLLLIFSFLLTLAITFFLGAVFYTFIRLKIWQSSWKEKYRKLYELALAARTKRYAELKINIPDHPDVGESSYIYTIGRDELEKSNIPARPNSLADTWTEFASFISTTFVLLLLSGFTFLYIFSSHKAF